MYLPSISVIIPIVVPFTDTFTPIRGSPVASTTIPLMVFCCAKTSVVHSAKSDKVNIRKRLLMTLLRLECVFKEKSFMFFLY